MPKKSIWINKKALPKINVLNNHYSVKNINLKKVTKFLENKIYNSLTDLSLKNIRKYYFHASQVHYDPEKIKVEFNDFRLLLSFTCNYNINHSKRLFCDLIAEYNFTKSYILVKIKNHEYNELSDTTTFLSRKIKFDFPEETGIELESLKHLIYESFYIESAPSSDHQIPNDLDDDNCPACQENPCMCSDPF